MNTGSLRYAGFGPRLASLLLDLIVTLPLGALLLWGTSSFRLFDLYFLIPGTLFGLFYNVYLVRRYGGTPGKLLAGIVIRKVDGTPVGYREAFLRFSITFAFSLLMSVTLLFPLFQMTDAEYLSLSFMERSKRLIELAPWWYTPLQWAEAAWIWSELLVLLTNKKRRALHDFIAGPVVVYTSSSSPDTALKPATAPQVG